VAAQDERRRAEQQKRCDTSLKRVLVVEGEIKVSLRTACILLGEHDAEIEAECERVRGEADILYPGPPPPLSDSLNLHSAFPLVFRKQSWLASMTC
jgi:hypothetical protein